MMILGLDIGDKRIGLSKGNPALGVATPYTLVHADTREKAIQNIRKIIETEKFEKVVYGLPIKESGEKGEQALKTESFVQELKKHCNNVKEWIPIDERYTTQMAQQAMSEMKLNIKKKKLMVDKLAAVLILQKYFNNL